VALMPAPTRVAMKAGLHSGMLLSMAPDGISTGAGWRLPGPLGIGTDLANDRSRVRRFGVARDEALAESVDLTFTLDSETYRLRRAGAVWSANSYEELMRLEEARGIIERVVLQRVDDVLLVSLLKTALSQLTDVHQQNNLVLVRLRARVSSGGPPPPTYTPLPPKPRRAPSPPEPPSIEEPVMSEEVALAQAGTLKTAAESGVPFCEECARAAAKNLAAANA
jgi:hypothetical protein